MKIVRFLFVFLLLIFSFTVLAQTDETLILNGIKFRGTKTKGHEYKHIEDAWDEGSPNTLKK